MADEIAVRVRMKERLKFSRDAKKTKREIEDIGDGATKSERGLRRFNTTMAASGNIVKLVKPVALITAIGILAQGVSALTAGVVALTAGLLPTVGILATIPGLGAGAASGLLVTKLATMGLTDALGGLHDRIDDEKFDKLGTDAQKLVLQLDALKPRIIALQKRAQKGLLPGLSRSVTLASREMGGLYNWTEKTGRILGNLAVHATKVGINLKDDLGKLGSDAQIVLRNLGMTGINLAQAMIHIAVAARPLTLWMMRGLTAWSANVAVWAKANKESGRLASFFAKTRESLQLLGGVLGPFSRALGNIFAAGYGEGAGLLKILGDSASRFEAWTASASGKNTIAEWFKNAMPAVTAMGRLVRDLTYGFFQLGQGKQVAPLIEMLRTRFLPALLELVDVTTREFGPVLIPALANVADLLVTLSGSTGPLVILTKAIGGVAGTLAKVLQSNPLLLQATFWATGLFGVLSALGALGFVSNLLGWRKGLAMVTGAFKVLKGACILTRIQLGLLWVQEKASAAWRITKGVASFVATRVAMVAARTASLAWAAAQWVLNAALTANPIGLIIVGIAALVAGFVLAYKKVGWFRDGVNALLGFVKKHWAMILPLLLGPIGLAVVLIVKKWDAIKSGFSTIVGFIRNHWKTALAVMTGPIGLFVLAVSKNWDKIKSGFKNLIAYIKDAWNSVASKLSFDAVKVKGKTIVPGINLPMLAEGGIVRQSGTVMVGEAGPELLSLPSGARVDPLPDLPPINVSALTSGASKLFAKLVLPDGRVLADLVASEVQSAKARA